MGWSKARIARKIMKNKIDQMYNNSSMDGKCDKNLSKRKPTNHLEKLQKDVKKQVESEKLSGKEKDEVNGNDKVDNDYLIKMIDTVKSQEELAYKMLGLNRYQRKIIQRELIRRGLPHPWGKKLNYEKYDQKIMEKNEQPRTSSTSNCDDNGQISNDGESDTKILD